MSSLVGRITSLDWSVSFGAYRFQAVLFYEDQRFVLICLLDGQTTVVKQDNGKAR